LTTRKGSAVVPEQVIQRGPQGAFAFVILENQTVEIRSVKVSPPEQGEVVVEEGLHPGERVVVDGQYKLQKGSRVKTAEAAGAARGRGLGVPPSKSGGRTNEPGSRGPKPAGVENEPGGPTRVKTRP
jgi:multidrug efflux system membrane fusion protein